MNRRVIKSAALGVLAMVLGGASPALADSQSGGGPPRVNVRVESSGGQRTHHASYRGERRGDGHWGQRHRGHGHARYAHHRERSGASVGVYVRSGDATFVVNTGGYGRSHGSYGAGKGYRHGGIDRRCDRGYVRYDHWPAPRYEVRCEPRYERRCEPRYERRCEVRCEPRRERRCESRYERRRSERRGDCD